MSTVEQAKNYHDTGLYPAFVSKTAFMRFIAIDCGHDPTNDRRFEAMIRLGNTDTSTWADPTTFWDAAAVQVP
jgi:hypothetical protein